MQKLTWSDTDEMGYQLNMKYPAVDPLTLGFPEIHRRITELEGFDDDPHASNEQILEAVQMAWLQYYRESG